MKIKRSKTCLNVEMPYKEKGEQYNNFAESCGRNHSKFSKPIYNFALFAFHLVRGFGIFNPRSSICPRLSWRRLKAGSRCRLGQQVLLRLSKVTKKYLLHTARNQPVLRPADKISKHYCIFYSSAIIVAKSTNSLQIISIQIYTTNIHRHI